MARGARLWKACEVLEISVRTHQRWGRDWRKGDARGEFLLIRITTTLARIIKHRSPEILALA